MLTENMRLATECAYQPECTVVQLSHDIYSKWNVSFLYLFACLFCLLAKPIHNLALRVFQRYNAELCEALSSSPEEVAAVLCNNDLVTRQERSQVVDVVGVTKFRKVDILVQAVERKLVAENSSVPLKKFCQVLRRHHGVGSIVSRMKFRLGE